MTASTISLLVIAVGLSFIGCTSMALSQNRNWKIVTSAELATVTKRVSKAIAWVFWLMALAVCVFRDGASFAALMWPLLIALASFVVAMILSFSPKSLRPIAYVFSAFGRRYCAEENNNGA